MSSVGLKVGEEAPDFTLPSSKDNDFTLSNLRGRRNVVLYFYPRDETIGCTKEACSFRDNYLEFTVMGAEVVGVSSDSVESHRVFIENHRLPFTLLSDQNKRVRKLYGAGGIIRLFPGRVTFIIDKKGIIRHIFSSQVQPTKHIQEALQILKQIASEEDIVTVPHETLNDPSHSINMLIEVLKSKIHRATVTDMDLNYIGSIGIDKSIMKLAGIVENEKVLIANLRNGRRLETYALSEPTDSGRICIYGPAGRLCRVGDLVVIMAFGFVELNEEVKAKILILDKGNKVSQIM